MAAAAAAAADTFTEEVEADEAAVPDPSPFDPTIDPSTAEGAPWIFILAHRKNAIYAIDCIGKSSPPKPKAQRFRLPEDLHGYRLRGSIGHYLLLEKQGSLSGIRLFDPISSSIHVASLPPSASLAPPPRSTSRGPIERYLSPYLLHSVAADTDSGIAVGLMGLGECRLAYTWIHGNPDNPDNSDPGRTWFNLTHLILNLKEDYGHFLAFGSAVVHKRGRFCLVDLTGTLVFDLDLSSPQDAKLSPITYNLPCNYTPIWEEEEVDWCSYQSASLLTSGSSLFLVRWRTILNKDGVKKRRDIDIYKYLEDKAWVTVNSLGDHSFFIDRAGQSISVSAADFPDIRSNRVYLALDATTRIAGDDCKCPYDDDGEGKLGHHLVHDLGDKSWRVFYDYGFHAFPPRSSFWMIPRRCMNVSIYSSNSVGSICLPLL